jgi:hypothetical protein
MAVWLSNDISSSRPMKQPSLASKSKVDASHMVKAISAINDQLIPKNINDRTLPHYHWWPKKGTTEWISYEFEKEETVSSSTVYWFDDAPWGGCRVPQSWRILYKNSTGEWIPVENQSPYSIKKGMANEVVFEPITSRSIKLEVVLSEKNAAGVFEWSVK